MWDEHNTRKPMLLLRLSGWLLLRYEQRALWRLLFQEPPRNTRRHTLRGTPPAKPAPEVCARSDPVARPTTKAPQPEARRTRSSQPQDRDQKSREQRFKKWGTNTTPENQCS
jgi:hypothetical protein